MAGRSPRSARWTRALVVDDGRLNRCLASAILERLGVPADQAEDGLAALDALTDGAYDLVILDGDMPRMDGIEAVVALRSRGGAQPFVIAWTASTGISREAFCAAGADAWVPKGDLRTLTALIEDREAA